MAEAKARVGIIANPVSARDIRRVIANASNLQITDRANIVLRLLAGLRVFGIERVLMMPENGGIRGHVLRGLRQANNQGDGRFPAVDTLDMAVTSTVDDTCRAARLMCEAGVAVIVVLGGDGTHRAVASACGGVPIAGISTGTNNAFPEHREPTITGLAAGMIAAGLVPDDVAFQRNKWLELSLGTHREIALVDIAVVAERYVGARAIWRVEKFRELFVAFAQPDAIGMSAIAGLIDAVGRGELEGRHLVFGPVACAAHVIRAPIAPGLVKTVGVASCGRLAPDEPHAIGVEAGSIALDGEREVTFGKDDRPSVTLRVDAVRTVDVAATMKFAARRGLFRTHQLHTSVEEFATKGGK